MFDILRNPKTGFQSSCYFTYYTTMYECSTSSHPHQQLLSSVFLIIAILVVGVGEWYLIVVLIMSILF